MKKLVILIMLVFTALAFADKTEFYIDADATVDGVGSEVSPFQLSQVLDGGTYNYFMRSSDADYGPTAGDTIYIKGTIDSEFTIRIAYLSETNWAGTEISPITIKPWTGQSATLTGVEIKGGVKNIIWEDINFHQSGVVIGTYVRTSNDGDLLCENMTFDGCSFYGQGDVSDANYIYANAIEWASDGNGLTVQDCNFTKGKTGVESPPNETLIDGCIFEYMAGSAIRLSGVGTTDPNNIIISNNRMQFQKPELWIDDSGQSHGCAVSCKMNGGVTITGNYMYDYGNTATIFLYNDTIYSDPNGYHDYVITNNVMVDGPHIGVGNGHLGMSHLGVDNKVINNSMGEVRDTSSGFKNFWYKSGFSFNFHTNAPNDVNCLIIANNMFAGQISIPEDYALARLKITDINNVMWAVRYGVGASTTLPELITGSDSIVMCSDSDTIIAPYDANEFYDGDWFVGGSDGADPNTRYVLKAGSPAIGFADTDYATATDILGVTRDAEPDVGAYEYVASGSDTTAPTPNPATFATPPAADSTTAISMTATTASDPCTPVYYLFTETSGNTGGTSSSWQTSASYTDTGLSPATQYTYTVQYKDGLDNTGTASAPASATTQAETPAEPADPCYVTNFTELVAAIDDYNDIYINADTFLWTGTVVLDVNTSIQLHPDKTSVTVIGSGNDNSIFGTGSNSIFGD